MNAYCKICKNKDLATLISLGWNGKMSATAISGVLGGKPTADAITKHLKEDVPGAWHREIVVEAKPLRQRVYDLQRMQIDEIERRIAVAEEKAAAQRELGREDADWSEYFDILDKDMQSAIGSILKAQGLADKNENAKVAQKIDMFRLMLGADGGLAPPELTDGMTVEGEAVEVPEPE